MTYKQKNKQKTLQVTQLPENHNTLQHLLGHLNYHYWKVSIDITFADIEFVKKFTPSDFQAKNFTPSISPNFNSFSKKKHKK